MNKTRYARLMVLLAIFLHAVPAWADNHYAKRYGDWSPDHTQRPIDVQGKAERSAFRFSADNINSLMMQCLDWYQRAAPGRVNDLYLSINYQRPVHLRKDQSHWRSGSAVCTQITSYVLDQQYLNPSISRRILLVGDIQGREFVLAGRNKRKLFDKCEAFYEDQVGRTKVKQFNVSVNGEPLINKRVHREDNRDSDAICRQVVDTLEQFNDYQDSGESFVNRSCGPYQDGDKWYDQVDPRSVIESCPNRTSGRIEKIYNQQGQFVCRDGDIVATGKTRRGALIDQINTCNRSGPGVVPGPGLAARSCGQYPSSSKWYQRDGVMRKKQACPDGGKGKIVVDYRKLTQLQCLDGTVVATGNKRTGKELKRYNRCESPGAKRAQSGQSSDVCAAGQEFTQVGLSRREDEKDSLCRVKSPSGVQGETVELNPVVGTGLIVLTCSDGSWKKSKTKRSWCRPDKL